MQGGEAGSLVIGIGTGVQEIEREFVVAVLDGETQCADPTDRSFARRLQRKHRFVHIDSGFQKHAHYLSPPGPSGKEQRRESGIGQWGANIGVRLEEQLDHLRMTLRRRPHQRGLSAAFFGIHLGAADEQGLHGPRLTGAGGRHQDGFSTANHGVWIGTAFEQKLHHRGVAVLAGQ